MTQILARLTGFRYSSEEHRATRTMKKQRYEKVTIAGKVYTLKVASASDAEKDWKLWRTDKKKYYEKFGR